MINNNIWEYSSRIYEKIENLYSLSLSLSLSLSDWNLKIQDTETQKSHRVTEFFMIIMFGVRVNRAAAASEERNQKKKYNVDCFVRSI